MLLNHVKSETESESVINNPAEIESIGIVSMGEGYLLDNYYSYRKRQLGFRRQMIFSLMDAEEIFGSERWIDTVGPG